jgi:hypothetical protein
MGNEAPVKLGEERGADVVAQGQGDHVPESLMHRLHEATVRFQKARSGLEETMNGFDYGHEDRVAQNEKEVCDAERALEGIDQEIKRCLGLKQSL